MKLCFLHIGTHKTGTTSIQVFLSSNSHRLESEGILLPSSGQGFGGWHHNLSWELAGEERFDPSAGTWEDALDEIRAFDPPTVCLTTEEFTLLYRKPEALRQIRRDLNALGYAVKIVVYLRPQADFIESLYIEESKYDYQLLGFHEYLEEILAGTATWQRGPRFEYEYLLDLFAEIFGRESLIVRPYEADREAHYLINQFIAVIAQGRKIADLDFSQARLRRNPSLNFAKVVELIGANRRKARKGESGASAASIGAGAFISGPFDPLSLRDLMRVHRRFSATNRALQRKYQVKIPTMTRRRLRKEILCAVGLNPHSARRKALLRKLDRESDAAQASDVERRHFGIG